MGKDADKTQEQLISNIKQNRPVTTVLWCALPQNDSVKPVTILRYNTMEVL